MIPMAAKASLFSCTSLTPSLLSGICDQEAALDHPPYFGAEAQQTLDLEPYRWLSRQGSLVVHLERLQPSGRGGHGITRLCAHLFLPM